MERLACKDVRLVLTILTVSGNSPLDLLIVVIVPQRLMLRILSIGTNYLRLFYTYSLLADSVYFPLGLIICRKNFLVNRNL